MKHRATPEEWLTLRPAVFQRDGGCISVQSGKVGQAAAKDVCRNSWGDVIGYAELDKMEAEHVSWRAAMASRAPDLIEHLVCICPGHHRMGQAPWALQNKDAERDYLTRLYPEHWAAEPCGQG